VAALVIHMTRVEREKVQDYSTAFYFYEKAAELGHPKAMHSAARFYLEGKGIDKDAARGFEWVQKCAEAQESICVFLMGMAYETGFEVEKNLPNALRFYEAAKLRKVWGILMHR